MNLNCLLVYFKKNEIGASDYSSHQVAYINVTLFNMYTLQGLMFLFAPYTCQIYSFKILEPYLPLGPCNECVFIHDHGWFTFSVYIISVGYAFVLDPPKKEKREP